MVWPYWFVIGLVLLAALVTIAYVIWITSMLGYEELQVPNEVIYPIACIYLPNAETSTMELGGIVFIYRDNDLQAPWQLEDKVKTKLSPSDWGDSMKLEKLGITKEPGYNSFRIYHKNKELMQHAYQTWTSSVFHAMVMPIELFLRVSLFPLWTMIDFVSHERKVAAGLIVLPNLYNNLAVLECVQSNVSIIEAYNSIYVKYTDAALYKIIPYDSSRQPSYFVEELMTYVNDPKTKSPPTSASTLIPAAASPGAATVSGYIETPGTAAMQEQDDYEIQKWKNIRDVIAPSSDRFTWYGDVNSSYIGPEFRPRYDASIDTTTTLPMPPRLLTPRSGMAGVSSRAANLDPTPLAFPFRGSRFVTTTPTRCKEGKGCTKSGDALLREGFDLMPSDSVFLDAWGM